MANVNSLITFTSWSQAAEVNDNVQKAELNIK